MSTTAVNVASLPRLALANEDNFAITIAYPASTDLSGKTCELTIRQLTVTDVNNQFTLSSAGSEITVDDAGDQVTIDVPPATTSDSSPNNALSTLQDGICEYGIDVLNSDGTLYNRFQGIVVWTDDLGELDDSYTTGPLSSTVTVSDLSVTVDFVTVGPTGATGAKGEGASPQWTFNATTTGPAASGQFRANNATVTSATEFFIHNLDINGNDLDDWLESMNDSDSTVKAVVYVLDPATGQDGLVLTVTGMTGAASSPKTVTVSKVSAIGSGVTASTNYMWTIAPVGNKGDTGSAGTNGADGASSGLEYTYNSSTSTPPASGEVRFNNATWAAATTMHLADFDVNSIDMSGYLTTWDDSNSTVKGVLIISQVDDFTVTNIYSVSAATDQGTYNDFTISNLVDSLNTPSGNVYITFLRTGDKGDTGAAGSNGSDGSASMAEYTFDTGITSGPASGEVRFNNATIGSVTEVYVHEEKNGAASVAAWIDTWDDSTSTAKGTLTVVNKTDPTKGAIFQVDSLTDNGTDYTVGVSNPVSLGGLPADADIVAVSFSPSGDKGDTGASGSGASVAILVDEKTSGTDGGTFTSGAWRTRDLNTEVSDPDSIVTISSNQFTLGAGTYKIEWSAPAYIVDGHQTRLYDVTGTAEVALGTTEYARASTGQHQTRSFGAAVVSPSSSNAYRIEHECATTRANNGFGNAASLNAERYTIVTITQIS